MKKWARRIIAERKKGCTVKEFKRMCLDINRYFDEIQGTDLETAALILFS